MAAPYKLRCNIVGHSKDVRTVAATIFPNSGIVSGSRDVTTRIWTPNEQGPGYSEGHLMQGHSNFVACVCVVPPDDTHPHGMILTGSNDSTILAYSIESPEPLFKLSGHESTVCSMAVGKFGTLISGSWDKTAKVWNGQKCVMTLKGHEAAVWAVAMVPTQGIMLTGSADKTIKSWKAGRVEKTFKGHEDCVRGLCVMNNDEFLSCSNDASIRRWLLTGDCLFVYYGHTNYIYGLAALPNGTDFVSSGEDRTLRVWRDGECVQSIAHPTESVWCVCCLQNGDVVTGASDGIIRVFTNNPQRMASAEDIQAYEDQVSASTVPTQVGDIKMEDIPGPEALFETGKKDGSQKMIRRDGKVELYSWDANETQWKKIGDVVGGSGGSQATSGKTLFEGKEYDFVFSVDIEEGKPPLKLPYNIAEDPWFAAKKFLDNNDLSPLFLDQVANFVVENTKGVTLTQTSLQSGDPFTGGARYVPGGGGDDHPAQPPSADPFTGTGRYIPGLTQEQTMPPSHGADPLTGSGSYKPQGLSQTNPAAASCYFPVKSYLSFDAVNSKQIMKKVEEFNETTPVELKLNTNQLISVQDITDGKSVTESHLLTIRLLLSWPRNIVFPALDLLRIVIKSSSANKHFCKDGQHFLQELLAFLSPDIAVANQMLTLRIISNMFMHSDGESLCINNRDSIITTALNSKFNANKNIQSALATVLLNFAVNLFKISNEEGKTQVFSAACKLLENQLDPEAAFRLLVCVGTLFFVDASTVELAKSFGLTEVLKRLLSVTNTKKVSECAGVLLNILK